MLDDSIGSRAAKLRQTIQLLSSASETLITQWEKTATTETQPTPSAGFQLPSHAEYEAEKTVKAALGTIEALACSAEIRLLEVSLCYVESRALHIVLNHHVPEILARQGHDGVHIDELGKATGLEKYKLTRILRLLASANIFQEVKPDYFANNRISQAYMENDGLQDLAILGGKHSFTAVDHLPYHLADPISGSSYSGTDTAFNRAIGRSTTLYEWFEEKVPAPEPGNPNSHGYKPASSSQSYKSDTQKTSADVELVTRPEKELFHKSMALSGKVWGAALVQDYPWSELGSGTVVDVGSGVGGFTRQLYKQYPNLNFILQDTPGVVIQAEKVWSTEEPSSLKTGRVKLMAHDFFESNVVKDAEVYWIRYILHNWNDDRAIKILCCIAAAMGPKSRILIGEIVMNTTLGCDEIQNAPEPLPPNYGTAASYNHYRDIMMLTLFNGIERTPDQFKAIIEAAGLRLTKIWKCRGPVDIVECRLA